jgi:Flp pilus assembly protein TadD
MQHPNHKLVGFLEGSLPESERAEVERHLAACPVCRAELGGLSAAGRALREAADRVARPEFDPALWSKVRAQVAPPRPRRLLNLRWAAASGGLAATAVAAMLIYVNGGRFNVPPDETPDASSPVSGVEPKGRAPALKDGRAVAPPAEPRPRPSTPSLPAPVRERPSGAPTNRAPVARVPTFPMPGGNVPPGAPPDAAKEKRALTAPAMAELPVAAEATPGAAPKAASGLPSMAPPEEAKVAAAPKETPAAGAARPEAPQPPGAERVGALAAPKASASDRDAAYKMDKGGSQGLAPRAQRYIAEAEMARRNNQRAAEAVYLNNAINAGLTGEDLRAARLRLGDVFLQQGDATRALVEFREANRIRPGVDALNRIGIACERTRDAERAREAYEQALRLDPGNAEAAAGLERLKAAG